MKKFFDDVKVSGNLCVVGEISSPNDIFVSDVRVATEFDVNSLRNELDAKISNEVELLNNTISTKESELKSSIQEGDSKLQENIDKLREETLEGDGSLLSQLEEFKNETSVNFQSVTDSISAHSSFCDEKFTNLEQKDSSLESLIENNGQLISDLNKDFESHKEDKSNPHEVTLSQLISKGAYAEIEAGEEGNFDTVEIRARDLNRRGNDYVLKISPEEASLSSGGAKILLSDGSISFSVPASSIEAQEDNHLVIKKQLDSSCEELKTLINEKINEQTHFDFDVVSKLPDEGVKGIIYLVLRGGEEANNVHEEYIWNDKEKIFEKIGDTKIDLTPYALNSSLEAEIARAKASEAEEASRAKTAESMLASEVSRVDSEYKEADTALEAKIESAYKLADEVISGRLQVVEKHMTDYEAKAVVTESKISSLESSSASASSEISNNSSKIVTLESTVSSINSEIASLKTADATLSGKIDVNSNKIAALESLTAGQGVEINILKSSSSEISNNSSKIALLESSVNSINSEITSLKTEDATLSGKIDVQSGKISTLESSIDGQKTEINALKSSSASISESVALISSEYKAADESIITQIELVSAKADENKANHESLAQDFYTTKESLSSIATKSEQLITDVEALESANETITVTISSNLERIAVLEEKSETSKSTDNELSSRISVVEASVANCPTISDVDDKILISTTSIIKTVSEGYASNEKLTEAKQQVLSDVESSYVTKETFAEESSKNTQSIEANTSEIGAVKGRVEALESKEDLKPLVEANTASINAHTSSISANTASITGLTSRVESLESKLSGSGEDLPSPDIPTTVENEKFLFTAIEGDEASLTFTCNYSVRHSSGMVLVQVFKVVSEGLLKSVICDISVDTANYQVTITLSEVTGTENFAVVIM